MNLGPQDLKADHLPLEPPTHCSKHTIMAIGDHNLFDFSASNIFSSRPSFSLVSVFQFHLAEILLGRVLVVEVAALQQTIFQSLPDLLKAKKASVSKSIPIEI